MSAEEERLTVTSPFPGHVVEHPVLEATTYLRAMGYPVDVLETYVVRTADGSAARTKYVQEVRTTRLPTDHPDTDAVTDEITVFVGSCPDWWNRRRPRKADLPVDLTTMDRCKHATAARTFATRSEDDAPLSGFGP